MKNLIYFFQTYMAWAAAIFIAISSGSWNPVVMTVACFMGYYFLNIGIVYLYNHRRSVEFIRSWLKESKRYLIKRYPIWEVIPAKVTDAIEENDYLKLSNYELYNFIPKLNKVAPLKDATCYNFHPPQKQKIFMSFDPTNPSPLDYWNLLHEVKHGSIHGVSHSLQGVNSYFRVLFYYMPLILFVTNIYISFAILSLVIIHRRIEIGNNYAEIASEYFAFNAIKLIYPDQAIKIARALKKTLEDANSALDTSSSMYIKSRIEALENILDDRVSLMKDARTYNGVPLHDEVANKVSFKAQVVVWVGVIIAIIFGAAPSHDVVIYSFVVAFICFLYWVYWGLKGKKSMEFRTLLECEIDLIQSGQLEKLEEMAISNPELKHHIDRLKSKLYTIN